MSAEELPLRIPIRSFVEYFQCPVCMCQMTDVHLTLCGHRYCLACIKESINRHRCCPCCRKPLQQTDLVKDSQFQELIEKINIEKEGAERDYFNDLVSNAVSAEGPQPPDKLAANIADKFSSPVEEVLKKHLKTSLLMHHNSSLNVQQSFRRHILLAQREHEERIRVVKEQCTMGTDVAAQLAVEQTHHEQQMAGLQKEMEDCAQLIAKAYDRYLDEHIPAPSVLPIRVSINILCKDQVLRDISIQPQHTIQDIFGLMKSQMEHYGDKVISVDDNVRLVYISPGSKRTASETRDIVRSLVELGATHPHIFILPPDSRPVMQFSLHSGAEICVHGAVKFESDMPKRCFVNTFKEDEGRVVDYFTCKDCDIRWICRACISACHNGHKTTPYILNHQPTWACCYCPKKKKCCISEK